MPVCAPDGSVTLDVYASGEGPWEVAVETVNEEVLVWLYDDLANDTIAGLPDLLWGVVVYRPGLEGSVQFGGDFGSAGVCSGPVTEPTIPEPGNLPPAEGG